MSALFPTDTKSLFREPKPAGGGKKTFFASPVYVAEFLFVLFAVLFVYFKTAKFTNDGIVYDVAINFVALCLEGLPFMLAGALVGGLIEEFVPKNLVKLATSKRPFVTIMVFACLGFVFPVCECAIVPVVRRLFKKGVPLGAAVAYLLGGPIVNPLVFLSTGTAYQYDWTVAFLRIAFGFVAAVCVSLLVERIFRGKNALVDELEHGSGHEHCGCGCHDHAHSHDHHDEHHHEHHGHDHDHGSACSCLHEHHSHGDVHKPGLIVRVMRAVGHTSEDFFDVGRFFVIGAFCAAFLRSSVGIDVFQSIASTPLLAILLMMALAVLLNLCSEADAFIAASFRGFLPGSAQMAFMVLGPMLDIKLVLLYLSVFRKKTIAVIVSCVVLVVLALMLGLEFAGGLDVAVR